MQYNFLKNLDISTTISGNIVAGGTEIIDRIKNGVLQTQNLTDITTIKDLTQITFNKNTKTLNIGSACTLSEISNNTEITKYALGLAQATENIATPQIRNIATIGGNLMQAARCPYFRDSEYKCLKKGGKRCYARINEYENNAIFQTSPCATVHPSTLGLVLKTYDAQVHYHDETYLDMETFFGEGKNVFRDNESPPNKIITKITLTSFFENEISEYLRIKQKNGADWPLIEVFVRYSMELKAIRIGLGGVANIPLRLRNVEDILNNKKIDQNLIKKACERAILNANPFEGAEYKVKLAQNALYLALSNILSKLDNTEKN